MAVKRSYIYIFLFILLFYSITSALQYKPYHFLRGDGSFYAQIARGLAEHFTLRQEQVQPRSWYTTDMGWNHNFRDSWSDIAMGRNGAWYPKHPFLMPLVALPFYLAFGVPGFLLFSILMASLGIYFVFLVAERFFGIKAALLALAMFMPFHIMVYNTYGFRNDIFYTALVAAALLFTVDERPVIAGTMAGLAIFAKITNILILVPVLLPLVVLWKRKSITWFSIAASIPIALFALSNWVMFGAPWALSYQRVLVMHNGRPTLAQHTKDFRWPFWSGIYRLLMDRYQGIVFIAPSSALGVLGLPFLFKKQKGLATGVLVALIAFFLFHAKYVYLWGRFFLPWYVLLMVPTAGLALAAEKALARIDISAKRVRLALGASLFGLFLVSMAVRSFLLLSQPQDLYKDVERLQVSLGRIPCDYFNMGDQKWECSHFDRGSRYFTGQAIGNECRFPGHNNRFLVIPASPRRVRRVTWRSKTPFPASMRVVYGLERGSSVKNPVFRLYGNNKLLATFNTDRQGQLKERILTGLSGIHTLTIEVAPAGHSRLCINIMPKE